jgi:hypothetical protein
MTAVQFDAVRQDKYGRPDIKYIHFVAVFPEDIVKKGTDHCTFEKQENGIDCIIVDPEAMQINAAGFCDADQEKVYDEKPPKCTAVSDQEDGTDEETEYFRIRIEGKVPQHVS